MKFKKTAIVSGIFASESPFTLTETNELWCYPLKFSYMDSLCKWQIAFEYGNNCSQLPRNLIIFRSYKIELTMRIRNCVTNLNWKVLEKRCSLETN